MLELRKEEKWRNGEDKIRIERIEIQRMGAEKM